MICTFEIFADIYTFLLKPNKEVDKSPDSTQYPLDGPISTECPVDIRYPLDIQAGYS